MKHLVLSKNNHQHCCSASPLAQQQLQPDKHLFVQPSYAKVSVLGDPEEPQPLPSLNFLVGYADLQFLGVLYNHNDHEAFWPLL